MASRGWIGLVWERKGRCFRYYRFEIANFSLSLFLHVRFPFSLALSLSLCSPLSFSSSLLAFPFSLYRSLTRFVSSLNQLCFVRSSVIREFPFLRCAALRCLSASVVSLRFFFVLSREKDISGLVFYFYIPICFIMFFPLFKLLSSILCLHFLAKCDE